MRPFRCLLIPLALAAATLAGADPSPRRLSRVPATDAPPAAARADTIAAGERTADHRAAGAAGAAGTAGTADRTVAPRPARIAPPVARGSFGATGLLEPDVMHRGVGRDVVVCFQPEVARAAAWQLIVREVDGPVAQVFRGQGAPPSQVPWDGRLLDGGLAWCDLAYTYDLVIADTTGTTREIAGEPFTLPPYSRTGPEGVTFLVAGRELVPGRRRTPGRPGDPLAAAAAGMERVAERLDQLPITDPVRIEVLARDEAAAVALAQTVRTALVSLLAAPGRPVEAYAGQAAAAPREGTVVVTTVALPVP